jgi:hypothetical protein
MFSHWYKLVATCRRSRAFSAIVVPAFVWATLPHAACICSDGRKETACDLAVCCRIAAGQDTDGLCCGCSCCQPIDGQQPSCCLTILRVEPAKNSDSARIARSTPCCTPVIEAPAPLVRDKIDTSPTHKDLVSDFLPALQSVSVVPAHSTTGPLDDHHGPPPLDAVIVFLHLTI